jgi:hypothetical protein
MEQYPSNSRKPLESKKETIPEKNIVSVVSGSAKQHKKSGFQKFVNTFISEDASNVKSYILLDVLLPAVKKAISDIVSNGTDMILYGESGRTKKSSTVSKVSYRNYYEKASDRNRPVVTQRSRSGFDYDNISFETRGDAEVVLNEMQNIIERYTFVSVEDLYDLADVPNDNYLASRYGWTNVANTQIVRTSDGYILKLPRAVAFD